MATITIIDPTSGVTKQITVSVEASMVIQDLLGEVEYFLTLSTSAKNVAGDLIAKQTITSLSDGAGGGTNDSAGDPLAGGKYASLTAAVDDYVTLMVEGDGDPDTAMAFA